MKENASTMGNAGQFTNRFKALYNDYSILFVALGLFLILSLFVPNFFKVSNLTNVLRQVSMVSIVAVGMFFCLVGGGIDLSAGAAVGFTGIFFADLIVNRGVNSFVAILLCLILGAVLGLLNGVLTSYGKLMPFVATVGTMSIAEGLALLWTNSYPVLNLPPEIEFIGRGYLWNIPFPLYIVAVVYIVAYFITEKTRYGRFLYASGGNSEASYLSGINVKRIRMFSYVICSITVAIAAVILCGRLDSAQPANGKDWGFKAITACVLGGTSMTGGKGKVLGVLLGAIFVGMLSNGMTLVNINSNLQTVANGVVLVVAVGIDVYRSSKQNKS